MTQLQKKCIDILIKGGHAAVMVEKATLYDKKNNPIVRISRYGTWRTISGLCKPVKRGGVKIYILSKSAVLALHGACYAKKTYKDHRNNINVSQRPRETPMQ